MAVEVLGVNVQYGCLLGNDSNVSEVSLRFAVCFHTFALKMQQYVMMQFLAHSIQKLDPPFMNMIIPDLTWLAASRTKATKNLPLRCYKDRHIGHIVSAANAVLLCCMKSVLL